MILIRAHPRGHKASGGSGFGLMGQMRGFTA